jgi:hypothetical protein
VINIAYLLGMKCRTCTHSNGFHEGPDYNEQFCSFPTCECIEFIPADNLDYVEWLANKRGLLQ